MGFVGALELLASEFGTGFDGLLVETGEVAG